MKTIVKKILWKRWCLTVFCLLLSCAGLSAFVYQTFAVPQRSFFAPDWGASRWIAARDAQTPVAYFRYTLELKATPERACVTIAASQVFQLYINGMLIASNAHEFATTGVSMAHIYDLHAFLTSGSNVLGVRVANGDQTRPMLRIEIETTTLSGTGTNWQATAQSSLVYPVTVNRAWTSNTFLAPSWPAAILATFSGRPPLLSIQPALYARSSGPPWFSAGSGQESYLVGTLHLPTFATVWLRLAAAGTAQVFVNGVPTQQGSPSPSSSSPDTFKGKGIVAGIYTLTPYLHSGQNILAIHVQSPIAQDKIRTSSAALALDLLVQTSTGELQWFVPDSHWHASLHYSSDWLLDGPLTRSWSAPQLLAHPSRDLLLSLPAELTETGLPFWSLATWLQLLLPCCLLLLTLWLLSACGLQKHYRNPEAFRNALQLSSLIFLPALACAALLAVLSLEPAFPSFYRGNFCLLLLLLVASSYLLLWSALRSDAHRFHWQGQSSSMISKTLPLLAAISRPLPFLFSRPRFARFTQRPALPLLLLTIMLLAFPCVLYNFAYEPYWQDELSSFYAAQGVLAHGLPFFPSGFLYEKAELFSYLLAFWQWLHLPPRLISVLLYLLSLPLLYHVGCFFFEKRCALLATCMLAFSPSTQLWSQQERMYELAQVLLLMTLWLLCRATEHPQRSRLLYLAMASLLAMYLSHEETFIALPGLFIAVFLCASRLKDDLLPAFFYQYHWWLAALVTTLAIALQLFLVHTTHPPVLGTDSSQRPLIQLTTDSLPFYLRLLLSPASTPNLSLSTLLAIGGLCLAFTQKRARFCALFFLPSLACLIFVFTMRAERYLYPLLPAYYLLAAFFLRSLYTLFIKQVQHIYALSGGIEEVHLQQKPGFRRLRRSIMGSALCLFLCLLLIPLWPLGNTNLLLSRLLNLSYHQHNPDYDQAGRYIQSHWRSGDIVICLSPDFSVFYYVGHADYFLSLDRSLFLLEQNNQLVDTSLGATALLNEDDLLAVLNSHQRAWLVSDNGVYQAQAVKRFRLSPDLRLVFEGYASAVYLHGG